MNYRRRFPILIAFLSILLGTVGPSMISAAGVGSNNSGPANETAPVQAPEPYSFVTENDYLALYIDGDTSRVAVLDKRSGKWWSMPETEGRRLRGGRLWKSHMSSAFVITYTDDKRRQIKTSNTVRQKARLTYEDLPDGVKVHYELPKLEIALAMEYRLKDDSLVVHIPEESIIEEGKYLLVTLEVMPFFGATTYDDEGYLFFPDGSGAISYFRSEWEEFSRPFSIPVYGEDEVNRDLYDHRPYVSMPVFGLRDEDNAFLGLVTEGEYEAVINAAPSGHIVDFNRVSSIFRIRKQYSAPIRFDTYVLTVTEERINSPRTVRYFFLNGERANYAGMAARYREYLMDKYGLSRIEGPPKLNLRVFGAAVEPSIFRDRLRILTTFAQTREIIDAVRERGIEEIDLTLVGWEQGGYAGLLPKRLPPEEALGGVGGLRDLVEYVSRYDIPVYLRTNYLDAFKGKSGFAPRNDVVRGPNKLPRLPEEDNFLLNAEFVRQKYASWEFEEMTGYGVHGVEFSQVGKIVLSDRNRRYPLARSETAETWMEIVGQARKELGRVSLGPNIYTVAQADRIISTPILDSDFQFADATVPFYQMVLHGLVPYYSYPGNLRSDTRWELLRNIEFGVLPSYELSYRHSSLLRDSNYNQLFSSQYTDWLDSLTEECQILLKELGHVHDKFITGHELLAPGVRMTIYEDGTKVIVNYNETGYRLANGQEVDGMDYLVVRGGDRE